MTSIEPPWLTAAAAAFWVGFGALAYTYCIYPLLLWLAGVMRGRPPSVPVNGIEPAAAPRVDVIVAAFNEQQHVESRVRNILQQEYPANLLQVRMGSDGSSDRTGELIQALAGERVHAFVFQKNRGKASVLNDLTATSHADILVFTDANTEFAPDAIARLVSRFTDPSVCCVCGELQLQSSAGTNQDSLYWRIERFLKQREGEMGGLLGAKGGIYALRRENFRPIPADTIVDDFRIAMHSALISGGRQVYEPSAKAFEDTPDEIADEYGRRIRIGIGNYQILFGCPEFWFGLGPATTFTYFSHKVLRWLGPLFLLLMFAGNAALISRPLFAMVFAGQIVAYALAVASIARFRLTGVPSPVRAAVFVLVLNIAFLTGFIRYVRGSYGGAWQRTARTRGT